MPPKARPNIIIILVDDMGYSDLGCYGGEIDTPNLDRLAQGGVRFTQFYNTPKCSPSRASLLTGLHPHQVGMGILADSDMDRVPEPPDGYVGDLSANCVTIAELLQEAGYGTYQVGKWHLSNNTREEDDTWPRARGFDHHYGNLNGATSYFYPATLFRDGVNVEDEALHDPEFYYTDAISDHAVAYINQHMTTRADAPFFMYIAYTCPHWPLHAKPEDIEKYRGKFSTGWDQLRQDRYDRLVEMGVISKEWGLPPLDIATPPWAEVDEPDRAWYERRMEVYAAMIDCMDQGVGRVIEALERHQVFEDTMILFLSDNGASWEEIGDSSLFWIPKGVSRAKCRDGMPVHHGTTDALMPGPENTWQSYGRDWASLSNCPFRGYKDYTYEGGIATPLIIHYPQQIPARGTLCHDAAQLTDILPTILDFTSVKYPTSFNERAILPPEGKSLLSVLLHGNAFDKEEFYWEHMNSAAIRTGPWKLVRFKNQSWELYNLDSDRTELCNLARKHPRRGEDLEELYSSWAERCNVLPIEKVLRLRQKYVGNSEN